MNHCNDPECDLDYSQQTNKQEKSRNGKSYPLSKPEGALTGRKMHLTSQARLPFRGLFSDLQQKIPRSTLICFFQSETFSSRWVKNLVDAFIYCWFHLCYKYWDTCNEIAYPCEKSFRRVMTGIKIILGIATKDSWSRSTLICYFQSELFSSKMRKRIWWMRSSTGSFISATNFGTATKVSAHYTHLLLSEWNILLKMKKENLVAVFIYWWFHLCYKHRDTWNEIAYLCEKDFRRVITRIKMILGIATIPMFSVMLHWMKTCTLHCEKIVCRPKKKSYAYVLCNRYVSCKKYLCYSWYFKNLFF